MCYHMIMNTKVCSKCKQPKHLSEFYSDRQKKDNLDPSCKRCVAMDGENKLDYDAWLKSHPDVKSVRGREVGKTKWAASMLYVAMPCSKCGRERWVLLRKILTGKMVTTLCRACWTKHSYTRGADNPNWRGGKHTIKGYVFYYITSDDPLFPMAHKSSCPTGAYIPEHRYVMAQHLGRLLQSREIVHHKNGVRGDNRLENLELIEGRTSHHSYNLLQLELKRLEQENNTLRKRLSRYE